MIRKKLIALAIVTQSLLSNFCMMPLASAMEAMPMDQDMQEMEQVTEMVMSPVNAMSSLHCEGCVTISRPRHHNSDMGGDRMPCNDGHCLSEHTPSVVSVTQSPLKDALKTAILPTSFVYSEPRKDVFDDGWNQRPPIQVTFVQTIVLRE